MAHILNYIKKNKLLWPVIFLGFLAHMAMIIGSGTYLCIQNKCGLYFFGIHGTDTVWHLALAAVSFNQFPFQLPIYAGATLGSYNYFMDLVVFLVSKLGLSQMFLYFKVLPIVWFILYTFSLIRFGLLIHKSEKFIALLLFLGYFCGSFAYILSLMHHGNIDGSSGLVALQSIHALANMQYAFSLVLLLEVLIIIKKNVINVREMIVLATLVFVSLALKFYGGVVTVFLVGLYGLTRILPLKKNSLKVLGLFIGVGAAAVLSIIIFYDPFSSVKTGSIFAFVPFATVHPMIETPELFYLPQMVSARYSLQSIGIGPRLIFIETVTLLLFIFFNFGIRIIGIVDVIIKIILRKAEKWEVLALLAAVFALLLNVLFVQKGQWWNTVQFLYYSIFITTLFTAQTLYTLLEKKQILLKGLAIVIILSSLPITFDAIKQFTSKGAMNYVPQKEIEALNYLKKLPNGVVFQPLFNKTLVGKYSSPAPMFTNYDNAYVAVLSQKPVYYSTEVQLQLVGIDYKKRLSRIQSLDCSVLDSVQYVYFVNDYRDSFVKKCVEGNKDFISPFHNEAAYIYIRK